MSVLLLEQKIFEALAELSEGDRLKLDWETVAEAKLLKTKITQVQKQLRLVKKDIAAVKKEINANYSAEVAKVGKDFGAVISTGLIGKKATGRSNAAIKNQLRRNKAKMLEPYEQVGRRIDGILTQLDKAKLEVTTWIIYQTHSQKAIATESPDTQTTPTIEPVQPTESPVVAGDYDAQANIVPPTTPARLPQAEPEQGSSLQRMFSKGVATVGTIAGWFFTVFWGISALTTIGTTPTQAIVFLIWAVACLPPFGKFIKTQGFRRMGLVRFAIFFAGFIIFGAAPNQVQTIAVQPSPQAVVSPSTAVALAPSPTASATPLTVPSPSVSASPSVLAQAVAPDRITANIVSTGDGDTLHALVNGESVTIRLACIDSPETAQPQGRQSADRLRQLLPRNAQVELQTVDTDRYGRTVAEVFRNGQSVNLQLVQEGRSVVYDEYLDGCAATRDRYLQAESQAQQQRLAFWSQSNPIMPWDWRRGERPPSPTPVDLPSRTPRATPSTASNCDPSYPGICIPANSPDLDCGDISQRRFAVRGADPHRFDGDRDGIGCES